MNNETLDSLIYVGIVLLVLSQIAEKITTFIRNYIRVHDGRSPANPKVKINWFRRKLGQFFQWIICKLLLLDREEDLARNAIREVMQNQQSRVEFAITKLSLLVCFIIALLFHADLFAILGSNTPHTVLVWGNRIDIFYAQLGDLISKIRNGAPNLWDHPFWHLLYKAGSTMFGCFCTGFLLTFGSKFFHDLLELLYEIKRQRRNLADEYLFRSPDLQTLDQRIAMTGPDIVRLVLERHQDTLMAKFPDIGFIGRVFDSAGESVLEIQLRGQESEAALRQYRFTYRDRDSDKVLSEARIRIVTGVQPIRPHGPEPLHIGMRIANSAAPVNYGTLGLFATRRKDGKSVFVTCYHVVKTEQHQWDQFDPTPEINVISGVDDKGQTIRIGMTEDARLDEWMDAAVIRLDTNFLPWNFDPDFEVVHSFRELGAGERCDVWVNGASSAPAKGHVWSMENAVRIDYGGGEPRTLYNLICVADNISDLTAPTAALTVPGDSGAILFDKDMNALGMIVAGHSNASFAIPISRILDTFNLALIPGKTTAPTLS